VGDKSAGSHPRDLAEPGSPSLNNNNKKNSKKKGIDFGWAELGWAVCTQRRQCGTPE